MGRNSEDGKFAELVEKVSSTQVKFIGMIVEYQSPSVGAVRFGWGGQFSETVYLLQRAITSRHKKYFTYLKVGESSKPGRLDFTNFLYTQKGLTKTKKIIY